MVVKKIGEIIKKEIYFTSECNLESINFGSIFPFPCILFHKNFNFILIIENEVFAQEIYLNINKIKDLIKHNFGFCSKLKIKIRKIDVKKHI